MAYSIRYKRSVANDLRHLSRKAKGRLLGKVEKALSSEPQRYPQLKGDYVGLRRLRVGNYRVIYALTETDVLVLRIGHRREVYR
ncbi:MAG: type II toxin-antitoxin system RelE/ParE family toxin [Candidatus Neomarinimicrobiota bacterium]